MVPTAHYLVLSAILFAIGTVGVLTRRNVIAMFMCIELMLNAVNLAFLAFSRHLHQLDGQIFAFFVMAVAAAEAAVGLALIVVLSRQKQTLDVDRVNEMKG